MSDQQKRNAQAALDLAGESCSLKEEQSRIRIAEKAGMEIFRGDEHTLTFDLDGAIALNQFLGRVEFLKKKAFTPHVQITVSKSGQNYHAVVHINPSISLPEPIRIAIQACLASDWKRELLGVMRYLNKQESVSLLFRPQPLEEIPYDNETD